MKKVYLLFLACSQSCYPILCVQPWPIITVICFAVLNTQVIVLRQAQRFS